VWPQQKAVRLQQKAGATATAYLPTSLCTEGGVDGQSCGYRQMFRMLPVAWQADPPDDEARAAEKQNKKRLHSCFGFWYYVNKFHAREGVQ
jgi:hypothetical protein